MFHIKPKKIAVGLAHRYFFWLISLSKPIFMFAVLTAQQT
jgi:hypothetical protein